MNKEELKDNVHARARILVSNTFLEDEPKLINNLCIAMHAYERKIRYSESDFVFQLMCMIDQFKYASTSKEMSSLTANMDSVHDQVALCCCDICKVTFNELAQCVYNEIRRATKLESKCAIINRSYYIAQSLQNYVLHFVMGVVAAYTT